MSEVNGSSEDQTGEQSGTQLPCDPESSQNVVSEMSKDDSTSTPMTAPLVRIEHLKEEDGSFTYTSEEEGTSRYEYSDEDHVRSGKEDQEGRESPEPVFHPPDDELRDKIIKQVEFYFSDVNILKDAFLLKHVRRNKQGFVSIKLITSFKKVKSMTKDYRVAAYSLRHSDKLEVNEEGKKVRRKDPLPDFDETTPSRSVVVVNLPFENPSIEAVAELFSKCGDVSLIRILRPGKTVPQDVKKYAGKHPEIGTTVCAVVEFEKHESAQLACDKLNNKDDWRNGMRVVILAVSKKKKNETVEKDAKETHSADERGEDKKKRKRGGRKKKNLLENTPQGNDSSCYSSGSESMEPMSRPRSASHGNSLSPNSNKQDPNRLSPSTTPKTSPRTSPVNSPRSQRRRGGHGTSPLVDSPGTSPRQSPRHSPGASPEMPRRRVDYSSAGDGSPSSPWVSRRRAAQISPLAHLSPSGSPVLGHRSLEKSLSGSTPRMLDMDGVMRQPRGPDGTSGFHMGRGKPRSSTFS